MSRFISCMATGLYVGYLPLAPGTWGTVVGVGLYWLLASLPPIAFAATAAAFVVFAIWVASYAIVQFEEIDPPEVVIDEIAGYLVTMAFHRPTIAAAAAGFLLFRLFDITKPPPLRWIEKRFPDGRGVVLDDVGAGIYANAALWICVLVAPMLGIRWFS